MLKISGTPELQQQQHWLTGYQLSLPVGPGELKAAARVTMYGYYCHSISLVSSGTLDARTRSISVSSCRTAASMPLVLALVPLVAPG